MDTSSTKTTDTSFDEERKLDRFSTPKKKPKYVQGEQSTSRRVKSFTQMKEKQSVSMVYPLLVLLWVVIFSLVVFVAFQGKLRFAEAKASQEIEQCKVDFEKNR